MSKSWDASSKRGKANLGRQSSQRLNRHVTPDIPGVTNPERGVYALHSRVASAEAAFSCQSNQVLVQAVLGAEHRAVYIGEDLHAVQAVRATLPYIRSDVPILIIFRALGLVADKDILQHVVYDFNDTAMMEALRPSLEEAFPIQSQEVRWNYGNHTRLLWTLEGGH